MLHLMVNLWNGLKFCFFSNRIGQEYINFEHDNHVIMWERNDFGYQNDNLSGTCKSFKKNDDYKRPYSPLLFLPTFLTISKGWRAKSCILFLKKFLFQKYSYSYKYFFRDSQERLKQIPFSPMESISSSQLELTWNW